MREAKSDKSTISSALFLCVSLYPADVVMSVCRRCVGRVATEMGGNAGMWEECIGQTKQIHSLR